MKAYQTIKYLAFAGAVSLWGCSSQQYAQHTEYDDLYFSTKDRKEAVYTASTSTDYSSIGNTGVASEDNSQKNVNPEYIQQYADQNRSSKQQYGTNANDSYSADNSYYDEDYRTTNGGGINLARNYNRANAGTNINFFPSFGYGNFYGGSAFYDPFYDPFFYGRAYYDPFFNRPFVRVRPGVIVSIGSGFGWGWNSYGWNRWGYDPFYSMYDPFYGGYAYNRWGDPFYNNYYYNPYRYYGGGNVIIVNPGNNNGGNNDPRTVRYSPRTARGSSVVNDNFNNTPRGERNDRGGRIDQNVNPNTNTGGRTPANISADGDRPARAVRPRGESQDYYRPQNTTEDYSGAGSRTTYSSPSNSGSEGISNPRAVRPRGNVDAYDSNRNNNYYDNSSNSNRMSSPTYSAPSSGRSPRSYDNNSTPRNDSWNNSNSGRNDNFRSNGGFNNSNSGSGGSFSNPSSSPRGGDGGGRSPRSPR